MAGVANIGSDRNWTGSRLRPGQLVRVRPARLEPGSSIARAIAEEWARMTWGNDPRLVAPVVEMMMGRARRWSIT